MSLGKSLVGNSKYTKSCRMEGLRGRSGNTCDGAGQSPLLACEPNMVHTCLLNSCQLLTLGLRFY